jgi:hypothetical protein
MDRHLPETERRSAGWLVLFKEVQNERMWFISTFDDGLGKYISLETRLKA